MPNFDWEAIKNKYLEGGTDVEVCKLLCINKREFENLYAIDKGFREFVDMGRVLAECYYLEQGRAAIRDGKPFQAQAWKMFMENQFGWSEKKEVKTTPDDLTPDQIKERIMGLLEKYNKEVTPSTSTPSLPKN